MWAALGGSRVKESAGGLDKSRKKKSRLKKKQTDFCSADDGI